MTEYFELLKEIQLIKQSLIEIERNGIVGGGWMSKKAVMRFFDYGDTQLRELEKSEILEVSKIKRRKFYSINSIIKLIEKNIQK